MSFGGRRARLGFAAFIVGGLALAGVLAFFVSPRASGEPDGLNKVAIEKGFAETEDDHALGDAPTAGYEVRGVDDDRLSTGLAGIIGVAITFAVAGGLFVLVRRRSPRGRQVAGAGRAAASPPAGGQDRSGRRTA